MFADMERTPYAGPGGVEFESVERGNNHMDLMIEEHTLKAYLAHGAKEGMICTQCTAAVETDHLGGLLMLVLPLHPCSIHAKRFFDVVMVRMPVWLEDLQGS